MSIVAWDGKTVAADKQGTSGDMRVAVAKIHRLTTGEVLAWVGLYEQGLFLIDWWKRGVRLEDWPDFQKQEKDWTILIVINKLGVWEYERLPVGQRVEAPFMAWGSGREFAMGAMAMGADAKRAVEIACQFNIRCGMGIDVMEVK